MFEDMLSAAQMDLLLQMRHLPAGSDVRSLSGNYVDGVSNSYNQARQNISQHLDLCCWIAVRWTLLHLIALATFMERNIIPEFVKAMTTHCEASNLQNTADPTVNMVCSAEGWRDLVVTTLDYCPGFHTTY